MFTIIIGLLRASIVKHSAQQLLDAFRNGFQMLPMAHGFDQEFDQIIDLFPSL
jgi:hypothetical protein